MKAKKGSTLFLKLVLLLIATIVTVVMLYFPQTEGRAKNLDLVSIYADPFILYLYLGTIPFFTALYQAFKLLSHIEQNKVFSEASVKALRNIKRCAIVIICMLIAAIAFVRVNSGNDDPAGAIAVGIVLTFATAVIATASGVFQSMLQKAVDIKSENDLTV